jgi:hypothetical protein
VAHEEDWADRLVNRIWDFIDRICYPDGKPQDLGKWSQSSQEERQGEKETPSTPTSKSTTEPL